MLGEQCPWAHPCGAELCWDLQHCLCHWGHVEELMAQNWWHVGTCSGSAAVPQVHLNSVLWIIHVLHVAIPWAGCLCNGCSTWMALMFAFPGLLSCFSSVESCHLSGSFRASLTSCFLELHSGARRDPGVSSEQSTWKHFAKSRISSSLSVGGVLLPQDHFSSHLIWDFFGHQSLVHEGQVERVSLIPGF